MTLPKTLNVTTRRRVRREEFSVTARVMRLVRNVDELARIVKERTLEENESFCERHTRMSVVGLSTLCLEM